MSLKHNAVTSTLVRARLRRRTADVERFVFVATTGRSGTATLARALDAVDGCRALHEPYPVMHREVLHAAARGDHAVVDRAYRQAKSIRIMRAAAGSRWYAETNHQFVKTFAEAVLADFPGRCTVIHLVRDPVAVANSILVSGTQPGTTIGDNWWLDPAASTNLVPVADVLDGDPRFAHPFLRGLWYWYEIEARTRRLRAEHPEVPFVELRTEDLRRGEAVERLLADLGMPASPAAVAVAAEPSNAWTEPVAAALPAAEAGELHVAFRELLAARGLLAHPADGTDA